MTNVTSVNDLPCHIDSSFWFLVALVFVATVSLSVLRAMRLGAPQLREFTPFLLYLIGIGFLDAYLALNDFCTALLAAVVLQFILVVVVLIFIRVMGRDPEPPDSPPHS